MSSNIKDVSRPVKGNPPVGRYLLRLGEMLSRQQLLKRMKISPKTLDDWEASGLAAYGVGTKEKIYVSDDVFAFLKSRPVRSR